MKTNFFLFSILFFLSFLHKSGIAEIYQVQVDTIISCPISEDGTNYYLIDINGDEIMDFKVGATHYYSFCESRLPIDCYKIIFVGLDENLFDPGPYFMEDTISYACNFKARERISGQGCGKQLSGVWAHEMTYWDQYAFIGLKFQVDNNFHYGWLRIKVDEKSLTIMSMAYNSIPNNPIILEIIE